MAHLLVTGGAGYIGCHALRALQRAGHSAVVFDDLRAGRELLVRGAPLVRGDVRDRDALDARVRRARPVRRRSTLRRVALGSRIRGEPPALLLEQRDGLRAAARGRARRRDARLRALLERGGLRAPEAAADPGERAARADQPLWRLEADGRAHARRRRGGPRPALGGAALLQRQRRGSRGRPRRVPRSRDPPDPRRARGRRGPARRAAALRHGLPDPRRNLRARLHPRERSGDRRTCWRSRPCSRAAASAPATSRPATASRTASCWRRSSAWWGAACPSQNAPRRPGDPPELVADATRFRSELGWQPRHSDLDTIVRTAWAWLRRWRGLTD